MSEVSHILKNATDKSLVILDEIGRGTSTYDGISLAWSIVEYIQKNIKCKTLFATHYHELTDLEQEFGDVKNYSIAVKEENENIIFLRKIIPQGADKSYGIYVAKLAKLPEEVINRSRNILKDLEKKHVYESIATNDQDETSESGFRDEKYKNQYEALKINHAELIKTYNNEKENYEKLYKEYVKLDEKDNDNDIVKEVALTQISFDNIDENKLVDEIINLDILNMTPLDAMNALYNLQKKAKNN
jgi:DNA mismatch repair protein MutS